MADQTAEEVEKNNIDKMGEPLGKQFSALRNEVAYLHVNWAEYVELFGGKPERIALLNRAAPMFFRRIQDDLWEAALLHIARLTDPSNSLGRKDKSNLTIQNLPELIEDATLKAEVAQLIEMALKQSDFSRDWRNRHIAHRDLSLALKETATPLAMASRLKAKLAISAITKVLNAVELHYTQSETRYDLTPRHNGAVSLLYVVDEGIKAQDTREERFQSGKPSPDDIVAKDL